MKRNLKSLLAVMLVLVLVLSLAGCSGKNSNVKDDNESGSSSDVMPEKTPDEVSVTDPENGTAQENGTEAPETTEPTATPAPTEIPVPESVLTDAMDGGLTWQEFMYDMGAGWNLGNTFDAKAGGSISDLEYETYWQSGGKTTKEMITFLKDAGYRTIRVPVSWHNHVDKTENPDGSTSYVIRSEWMARVKEVVDYCYDQNMYVIINIHHDDGDSKYVYPDADHEKKSLEYVTDIWRQIAETFGDYDLHVIFETMNEVRLMNENEWNPVSNDGYEATGYINKFNQAAVDVIRSTPGKYNEARYIGCPGYVSSINGINSSYVLPTDPGPYSNRIMVPIHAYVNWDFVSGIDKKFTLDIGSEITTSFANINARLTKLDIPCYIGEWGVCLGEDNITGRTAYVKEYLRKAATFCRDSEGNLVRIPCVLWDNNSNGGKVASSEKFGFFNRKKVCFYEDEYAKVLINSTYMEY